MFNTFDILLAVVMIASMTLGLIRGVIRECMGLLGWIFAGFVSYASLNPLAEIFRQDLGWKTPWLEYGVAALIFAFILFAMMALAKSLSARISSSFGVFLNRFLGMGYGALRGCLLFGLAFWLLLGPVESKNWPTLVQSSYLTPYILEISQQSKTFLPQSWIRYGQKTMKLFSQKISEEQEGDNTAALAKHETDASDPA